MYATHRHDLFYITVKYHQNIPNGIPVIERTEKCLRMDVGMDGRTDDEQTPGSSLYPPNVSVGDKKSLKLFVIVKIGRKHEGSKWEVTEVVPLRKNGRKTQGSKQEVT